MSAPSFPGFDQETSEKIYRKACLIIHHSERARKYMADHYTDGSLAQYGAMSMIHDELYDLVKDSDLAKQYDLKDADKAMDACNKVLQTGKNALALGMFYSLDNYVYGRLFAQLATDYPEQAEFLMRMVDENRNEGK